MGTGEEFPHAGDPQSCQEDSERIPGIPGKAGKGIQSHTRQKNPGPNQSLEFLGLDFKNAHQDPKPINHW